MTCGAERNSSFELLRIVCMLMILNLHTFSYSTITDFDALKFLDFTREATSISAVPIFVLISGFFGIKLTNRKLWELLFNCMFWSIGVYLVSSIFFTELTILTLVKRIYFFFLSYWFVTSYIGLLILSPILNKWLDTSNDRDVMKWMIMFYLFAIFCQFVNHPDFRGGGSMLSFCWLYCLGRFLKRRIDNGWLQLVGGVSCC